MRPALLALLVLAPNYCTAQESEYYPLKVGMKWTYKLISPKEKADPKEKAADQEERFVVTALKEEKVGEQTCVKLEAKLKDQVVGTEHVAVLKDGVYRFKFGDANIEPPICFFKPAAKKGETWKQDFKVGDSNASGSYVADVQDAKVPAGEYKGALVVKAEAIEKKGDKPEVTKTTIWFAKGVGMVKQDLDFGELKITLELEKVEMPKK